MKILYYNWAPLNTSVGGGVNVYMKNVLQYLSEMQRHDVETVFLSAGWYYDKEKQPYIRREDNYYGTACYSLVNSPILAPSSMSVCQIKDILKDGVIKKMICKFILEKGPFDVFHFQSLEGIAPNVMELKSEFPTTKFIHSVHDYGLICPNVRLWTTRNTNCYQDSSASHCAKCMRKQTAMSKRLNMYSRSISPTQTHSAQYVLSRILAKVVEKTKCFFHLTQWATDEVFESVKSNNIELINKFSDAELCVSGRVAEIMEHEGVLRDKIKVCYIGTKVAENQQMSCKSNPFSDEFTILYMGYASVEKGFFVFLDALEQMGKESQVISLKFASKISDKALLKRINKLREKFKSVELYNGYSHADFPKIMQDVNLGIVAPQWEDNLPQVTIEMIANGVPVMTSSYGGAHELNSHLEFSFNDREDLMKKINKIMNNRSLLCGYWEYSKKLTTMEVHISQLMDIYNNV